jgi:hypothetical protein
MRTDNQIASDVAEELRWSPDVKHSDITVEVADGIVTLTGSVCSHHDKNLAECAAKRVLGVTGIANDIQVRPSPQQTRRSRTKRPKPFMRTCRASPITSSSWSRMVT